MLEFRYYICRKTYNLKSTLIVQNRRVHKVAEDLVRFSCLGYDLTIDTDEARKSSLIDV